MIQPTDMLKNRCRHLIGKRNWEIINQRTSLKHTLILTPPGELETYWNGYKGQFTNQFLDPLSMEKYLDEKFGIQYIVRLNQDVLTV